MKTKGILSIIIFLMCYIPPLQACSCGNSKTIKNYDLKHYSHISLAKIKNIKPDPAYSDTARIYYHIVEFESIELFKGKILNEVLIAGGNPLAGYSRGSSCDIPIHPEEEWILLIQNINGKNIINFCTKSDLIKTKRGLRKWEVTGINKNLKFLRTHFFPDKKYPEYVSIHNGTKEVFYSSGQMELQENFKNGELDGERKVWHLNGNLHLIQNFKNGKKNGVEQFWKDNGFPQKKYHFSNDLITDTAFVWFDTDTTLTVLQRKSKDWKISVDSVRYLFSAPLLSTITVFNDSSEVVYNEKYAWKNYLHSTTTYLLKQNKRISNYYCEEGGIYMQEVYKDKMRVLQNLFTCEGYRKFITEFNKGKKIKEAVYMSINNSNKVNVYIFKYNDKGLRLLVNERIEEKKKVMFD